MRKPTIRPRLAVPMTLLAVGGGWAAGATLGTPSLSAAATASTTLNNNTGNSTAEGFRGNGKPGGPAGLDLMAYAAKDIGITKAALRSGLSSGKTVAQVAAEHNVAAATLISELVTTAKTEITGAYTAGKITSTRESNMLANVGTRVTDFVDNTRTACAGPGGQGGFRGGTQTTAGSATATA
ncbi:MAG: hypothetical protein M0Z88_04275 [Actinomycetota bacterium]|nr:hypothetical protein [Actinomycetota bacterium]